MIMHRISDGGEVSNGLDGLMHCAGPLLRGESLRLSSAVFIAAMAGLGATGCLSAAPPVVATAATADSIALERVATPFDRVPAYRVSVSANGRVRFENRTPPDSGTTSVAQIESASARDLIALVGRLPFDSIPEQLVGLAPYCQVVASDGPWAVLSLYSRSGVSRIRDYIGCREQYDRSPSVVIRRLRDVELAIDSVAGVSRWIEVRRYR